MSDLIDRQAAIDAVKQPHGGCYTEAAKGWAVYQILSVPSADAVEVVRCKDCIHRPTGTGANHDLEFPDSKCPCQCEDYWYSWMPNDDWFCANGERRTDATD